MNVRAFTENDYRSKPGRGRNENKAKQSRLKVAARFAALNLDEWKCSAVGLFGFAIFEKLIIVFSAPAD